MTALSEDKVLRINCPGFGASAILPLGEAKPLAMYEVIIVNPSSVLHLFETGTDLVQQIEMLQSDGMTSYRAESDGVIENISTEFELRGQEINQFLKKGGLLIYFLCPPFTVSGPNETMDNYTWLKEWCPDRPSGPNLRNMSATIRGKAIEACADAAQGIWVPYLKQAGLEWSTIIRNDNLTEGFVPLALAGPNKCIAGVKSSGPKNGQVVFLPAPYGPEYDAKLHECIDRWFTMHNEDTSAPSGLQNLSKGLSSMLGELDDRPVAQPEPEPAPLPVVEPEAIAPAPAPELVPAPAPVPVESNGAPEAPAPQFFDRKSEEVTPEPETLIKKMQQNISDQPMPEWCATYSFEELSELRDQLTEVTETIQKAQTRAKELEERIQQMDNLKNALIAAQGEPLLNAVTKVFERVGWTVKPSVSAPDELWLVDDDKTQAIVRLIHTTTQPNRAELAALAESVITYWGAHEIEPKGILVVSSHADKAPPDRPEEDFPDSMVEFAKRKNLCLLTTLQMLSVYRDVDMGRTESKEVRENVLTTSGCIGEYKMTKKGSSAAGRKR